ncbi:hypothetical protein OAT65_00235 [Flavobacteriaceae bacterium]|nr:hypothetical protein [Flavobacteriaceae bacterium]
MKKLLFLFLSFFCLVSFSQENLPSGQLLIAKDSLSFYSFSKTGVYDFTIRNGGFDKVFYEYSKPLPSEIKNIPMRDLQAVVSDDGIVYFLNPGGGLLFEYRDNHITRIDESFPHRNQFSGHFFIYKKAPYLMGGYGYWKSNSILTKFNFQAKEWDYIETRGQAPELGINEGSFVIENDVLYVFDFYQKINDVDVKNNNTYEFDLSSLKWEKKGSLNRLFYDDINRKILEITIPFGSTKFLQKKLDSKKLLVVEPSKNSVKTYINENLVQVRRNAIYVGDKIIYTSFTADRAYETLIIKDFYDGLILESEASLTNDYDLFISYFLVVIVFCFLLVGLTFLKFKRDTVYFVVNKNTLIGLNKSMNISKEERFVIELLSNSKNSQVDNIFFLNYFKKSELSEDANIKRKNKAINDLNVKFKEIFQLELIMKSAKQSDSRQVVYSLNPKIII